MTFRSGKIFTHSVGLSCCFRQYKAIGTNCRYIHGYSLQVELEFERQNGGLDDRNWVMGFGDLKPVKAWLENTFDHKTLVAADDPAIKTFKFLAQEDLIQLVILDGNIGIESFAFMVYKWVRNWTHVNSPGVELKKVTIREHEGNWASYIGDEK